MEKRFLLVDVSVLPEVFLRVLRAKELLASGAAKNISVATRMVDVSRSAFYKYKDCIFDAEDGNCERRALGRDRCTAGTSGGDFCSGCFRGNH